MLPATPFKDRLSTNYIPSDDETIAIQKLIEAVEPQIVSLDAEIETMKQRRGIYASFVADHRALISPIRHMPPDILRNIFSHCVLHSAPEKVMQASEAPLLLGQICRHWRDLVLKTPILWSTIFLKIPEPPYMRSYGHQASYDKWCRKLESLASAATTWLSRAEGCPLTISFRDIDLNGFSILEKALIQEKVDIFLSLICARSSQWAQLDLQVAESSPTEEALLSLSPSQTPNLQSIRMRWSPAHSGPPSRPYSPRLRRRSSSSSTSSTSSNDSDTGKAAAPRAPLDIFKGTRLQHLSLGNFGGNFKDIPIVWGNLTELSYPWPSDGYGYRYHRGGGPLNVQVLPSGSRMTAFSPAVALALLQQCPNLVRCELHLLEPTSGSGDPVPIQHVHLPYLQRLVVSEQTQGLSLTFFQSLINLPLLASMSWSSSIPPDSPYPYNGGAPTSSPYLPLHSLLLTSGHQIQSLEFGDMNASMTQIIDCLKLAVGVTELTINMYSLSPADFGPPTLTSNPLDEVQYYLPWKSSRLYRDELLTSLTPSSGSAGSATETTAAICPSLSILKLVLAYPSDITTKALKNLVALRGNGQRLGHSQAQDSTLTVPLTQVTVRFTGLRPGTPTIHGFSKRWNEDRLNSGFSRHIIKLERPRADVSDIYGSYLHTEGARRKPFETYWDYDSVYTCSMRAQNEMLDFERAPQAEACNATPKRVWLKPEINPTQKDEQTCPQHQPLRRLLFLRDSDNAPGFSSTSDSSVHADIDVASAIVTPTRSRPRIRQTRLRSAAQ
ncbi:hypothetical protein BKA70DRAFT_1407165 [Coprinopsis sp. MPI-PUGE-AT-0042]|nr:hypothetical protein BKA70DRAFT_1407165 [Coprinopsis sp. MPI-PUGE-AT-0042]